MTESALLPLLQVRKCLLGSIQHGLHDRRAWEMGQYLLTESQAVRPKAVILDFTAINVIDSFLSRILLDTANGLRLIGSRLLLCGLPDPVIVSMVELGIVVPAGTAVRDVDAALDAVAG
jgi:rsbT antagonist protein RsbS